MAKELENRQLEELLTGLKSSPPLSPYSLTLYHRQSTPRGAEAFQCCRSIVEDPLCRDVSRQFFEADMEVFFEERSPSVCRYGGGFFGFLIPFSLGADQFCLVGDGVRDETVDLWQLASLSSPASGDVFSLLPYVESLSIATYQDVERVAQHVAKEIEKLACSPPDMKAAAPKQPGQERTDLRLAAIAETLERVDSSKTIAESIALCCETIVTQFQVPGVAIALRSDDRTSYLVNGLWGLPDELGSIPADGLKPFLAMDKVKKTVLFDSLMRKALPLLRATICINFPLSSQGEKVGFLVLTDTDLPEQGMLLVSILTNALAGKLLQIVKDAEQTKETALSEKLMSLTDTLLQVDRKDELYEAILSIASDLIDATQGSIMLIDKDEENMRIVFTLGMTLNVARCLPVKVGKGIAGMVAQTGQPLLVNDVEKDSRVAMANRTRFKSKSLICIPLKLKDKIIGVLNLSDKKNLAPFTNSDLQVLTSFANLASLMIERTEVLEESERFEQLSVTDALTGLYNRRFLKNRLEEELNRSIRQGLNLTVLFIDLDFFKNYNDLCGHLAGDEALKITAEIIKGSLRDMDIVARYGGEEFCAVLPGTSKEEALIVAERIRFEIEAKKFPMDSELPLARLTASLGVASFPEDGRTFKALVHASDVALYEAKATGRNRIVAARTATVPSAKKPDAVGVAVQPNAPPARAIDFNTYLEASLQSKG